MGYIWAIYYLYLLTYLLLPFPVGYPSYYPAGTRVINYPDTAALLTNISFCSFMYSLWRDLQICSLHSKIRQDRVWRRTRTTRVWRSNLCQYL